MTGTLAMFARDESGVAVRVVSRDADGRLVGEWYRLPERLRAEAWRWQGHEFDVTHEGGEVTGLFRRSLPLKLTA